MTVERTSPELTMRPTQLSALADRHDMELHGPDREIVTFGATDTNSQHRDRLLSYATSSAFLDECERSGLACIAPEHLRRSISKGHSALITNGDVEKAFYSMFLATVDDGAWETLTSGMGARNNVAASARIAEGVEIGSDCVIMDNVVILPNTRIGDRVTIKPNAVIGGWGFEAHDVSGGREMIPHVGGVCIESDVWIGSQTCVDRGLFGDFTTIGAGAKIDNLVHVGHGALIGERVTIAAASMITRSRIGDGAWIGPQTAIGNRVEVGRHCFVGTGSTVVRSLPPHALAYGVPARPAGWVCRCRAKLTFDGERATCARCGNEFVLRGVPQLTSRD